jgi:hypothetical protein
MVEQIDWNSLYSSYLGLLSERFARTLRANSFEPPREVVAALANPNDEDARWLIEALRHEGKRPEGLKWFVASFFFRRSQTIAEIFFVPLLDAAVDEVNPSDNRRFVEPCMKHFGPRRVNEYLLSVVEFGTDVRRAGAVNALYWSQVALLFRNVSLDDLPPFDLEHATAESRTAYMALQDVWERKKRLFLETFVANASVEVRRSIIAALKLDPQAYPDNYRPLVAQAIAIARSHKDAYIRHRVEFQLGDIRPLAPLPHRGKAKESS